LEAPGKDEASDHHRKDIIHSLGLPETGTDTAKEDIRPARALMNFNLWALKKYQKGPD